MTHSILPALALATVFGVSTIAPPAQANCAGSVFCNGKIAMLYVYADTTNTVLVKPVGGGTPKGCTLNSGVYAELKLTTPTGTPIEAARAAYNTLLAAYLAGSPVTLRLGPGGADGATCQIIYVTLPNLY